MAEKAGARLPILRQAQDEVKELILPHAELVEA
jgi:hypothetical protein